jgi:uncharacterized protein (DUF433 family)
MATGVVSMRVPEDAKNRLERFSRYLGKKPSEAGAMLLEEGLRRAEHPYIDFRNTRIGRQAYLKGSRLAVWYIYQVASDYNFSISQTSEHLHLSESKVKAALHYAGSYPKEIEIAMADNAAGEYEALKGLLPDLTPVDAPKA